MCPSSGMSTDSGQPPWRAGRSRPGYTNKTKMVSMAQQVDDKTATARSAQSLGAKLAASWVESPDAHPQRTSREGRLRTRNRSDCERCRGGGRFQFVDRAYATS